MLLHWHKKIHKWAVESLLVNSELFQRGIYDVPLQLNYSLVMVLIKISSLDFYCTQWLSKGCF